MNQNQKQKPKRKKRGAAVAAVLCFVAAIAIVGTYTFKDYKKAQKEQLLAQTETPDSTKEAEQQTQSEEATTDLIVNEAETDSPMAETEREDTGNENGETETQEEETNEITQTAGDGNAVSFDSNSKLLWPISGSILMNYSMDKTVYHSTLDQYKYNPALIISGAEGDQVISAAPGIVKSIDKTAETGTTVNVDLGNGYELFYGQLKEVPVNVGDYVGVKTILGYVSQPTKYYSVEGSNVYFEMRKDGQPVNPMEYLVD